MKLIFTITAVLLTSSMAIAQTPTVQEMDSVRAICESHRNPLRSQVTTDKTGHMNDNSDQPVWQSGWESCESVQTAWRTAHDNEDKAKLNNLIPRIPRN